MAIPILGGPEHRFNQMRNRMIAEWSKQDAQARRLEAELKTIDPYLEVYFVDPRGADNPNELKAPHVVPGRWHIVRRNPNSLDSWFPIMGPNKEFREPELKVAEDMKAADLWRPGALKELRDAQDREAKAQEAEQNRRSEQRVDEMRVNYRAAKRMPGAGGMVRAASQKGKKKPKVAIEK